MKNLRSLTLVLLLLAGVGLGCSTINKLRSGLEGKPANTAETNSNSGSTSPSSEPGSAAAGVDPKAEIIAASKKFVSLNSFRATMNTVGETSMNMTLEYQAPDRYHMKSDPIHGVQIETIMIGSDTYASFGGKWTKMPGSAASQIPAMRQMFTEEGMKRLSDVKYEGVDTVNGKPADKYSYEDPGKPESSVAAYTSTIWVNKATGLPMKVEVGYKGGKLKSATITYDTDTPVKIEKPI
ncbi:MAG TPA: hypothetical protein PKC65_06155 [Pyrinomonadaceae bacterium]|nr:hypothetical protein [Pyrinomonadaceae bacterium]